MSALQSDRIIAGGPHDFLTARHLVLRGTQREVGRALCGIATRELGVDKAPWSDATATRANMDWLEAHWPAHRERARGVSGALGLAPGEFSIDPSFLYYDWAVPGCSNVFWPGATTVSGHAVLSRNYDFTTGTVFELMGRPAPPEARPATCAPVVMQTHPTDHGYATLLVTSYELLGSALDGVNSEGLAVALMATVETLRGGGPPPTFRNQVGLNEIQLIRFLLETASTAQEARTILREVPIYTQFVPCHYLIGDRYGDHFVFSPGPGEPVFIEGNRDAPTCATNHLDGYMRADIPQRAESVARLGRLRSAVASELTSAPATPAGIARAAHSVAATLPSGEGQYASASPARTLWHAFYDLERPSVTIDFYLGEDEEGGIRRSEVMEIALE